MSKQITFSIDHNENESTPLFDRVERKELRAQLISYPNFKVPMPAPKAGKWENDTAYTAYSNKLKGWKNLFAHHKREIDLKKQADERLKLRTGTSFGTGTIYSQQKQSI